MRDSGKVMTNGLRDFNDRRKYARANIHALTRYSCPLSDSIVEIQTRISDISEGGVLMVTFMEGLPPETLVKMSFVIPGSKSGFVTVSGKVKYTGILEEDSYRSGIEFLDLEKKDQLAIREYVASHPGK